MAPRSTATATNIAAPACWPNSSRNYYACEERMVPAINQSYEHTSTALINDVNVISKSAQFLEHQHQNKLREITPCIYVPQASFAACYSTLPNHWSNTAVSGFLIGQHKHTHTCTLLPLVTFIPSHLYRTYELYYLG